GNAIVNSAIVRAAQDVNLMSAVGNFTNSGFIAATTGNINVSAQAASNINIYNAGGVLQALNGGINVRDAQFSDKADLSIIGGDLLSKNVNLYSGKGNINVDVNNLTGTLSMTGG